MNKIFWSLFRIFYLKPIIAPYFEYISFTSTPALGLAQSCIYSDTSDSRVIGITPACSILLIPYLCASIVESPVASIKPLYTFFSYLIPCRNNILIHHCLYFTSDNLFKKIQNHRKQLEGIGKI